MAAAADSCAGDVHGWLYSSYILLHTLAVVPRVTSNLKLKQKLPRKKDLAKLLSAAAAAHGRLDLGKGLSASGGGAWIGGGRYRHLPLDFHFHRSTSFSWISYLLCFSKPIRACD